MENFDLKKFIIEGKLLKENKPNIIKENAPGYDTRKTGEALPTLEGIKAAFEAKNNIKEDEEDYKNDYANSEEDFTDRMVIQKIFDIMRYHEVDPSEMLEEIGQEFGIDFEFGAGNGRMEENQVGEEQTRIEFPELSQVYRDIKDKTVAMLQGVEDIKQETLGIIDSIKQNVDNPEAKMDLEVSFERLPKDEIQRLRIALTLAVTGLDKMIKQA